MLLYFKEKMALELGYSPPPTSRPKHACLKASSKSLSCVTRPLDYVTERREPKPKERRTVPNGVIATQLGLFRISFNSLKRLLKYDSYLKICKTVM